MTPTPDIEADPRFPSGPWTGFFLDPRLPGKHKMELHLTFTQGGMQGEGRDWVGKFIIRGKYELPDGRCHWTKRYLGRHDVFYKGFNEGKGIWGTWELSGLPSEGYCKGGFHIWPEGMPDPTQSTLVAEADLPVEVAKEAPSFVPALEPVGRSKIRQRLEGVAEFWRIQLLGMDRHRRNIRHTLTDRPKLPILGVHQIR